MTLQLQTAAVNQLRSNHWVLDPVSGLYGRSTLLEGQSTNLCTRSEPTKAQLIVGSGDANISDAGSRGTELGNWLFIGGGTGVAVGAYAPVPSIAGSTQYSVRVRVELEDGSAPVIGSTTATGNLALVVNGSIVATAARVERIGSSNQYWVSATLVTGAAVVSASFGVIRYTTQPQGKNFWVSEFQCVTGPVISSYIATAGATVTRSADSVYRDLPAGLTTPQALTAYMRFIELGTILSPLDTRLLVIGAGSGAAPRFDLRRSSDQLYIGRHDNGATTVQAKAAVAPAVGDLVEIALSIDATTLKIEQSINGAAKTTSSVAANSFAANWSDTKLWVNSINGGVAGGFIALLSLKLARGAKTLEQMRAF